MSFRPWTRLKEKRGSVAAWHFAGPESLNARELKESHR